MIQIESRIGQTRAPALRTGGEMESTAALRPPAGRPFRINQGSQNAARAKARRRQTASRLIGLDRKVEGPSVGEGEPGWARSPAKAVKERQGGFDLAPPREIPRGLALRLVRGLARGCGSGVWPGGLVRDLVWGPGLGAVWGRGEWRRRE